MEFRNGDVVAVRKTTSGTFGSIEYDWMAGIYDGKTENGHMVYHLPVSEEFKERDAYEVREHEVLPAWKIWPWLKGFRMMREIDNA
jgi:hypothetical protein